MACSMESVGVVEVSERKSYAAGPGVDHAFAAEAGFEERPLGVPVSGVRAVGAIVR
jgi:hypothetical protein